ncbi:MAG: hypothetical protein Q8K70_03735 [Bacteroidota bacterium]|nr:hypothetical protein [Bacteroidota bacterium]
MRVLYYIALFFVLSFVLISCKKSSSKTNPYDDWKDTKKPPVVVDVNLDPNTIEGLHKNIFKPTCSNSGCHDGNFEPDFRSVESSYNSLINRLTTNYDPNNPQFGVRVVPGDAAKSMLLHRILEFIPGSQGKMPLTTDPGSDWPEKKEQYIENIRNWINAGAKDQFGNSSTNLDFPPQLGGLIAFVGGSSTPLPHLGYNPIVVPSGANQIKIMVAFLDDKTPLGQMGASQLNYSLNPNDYQNVPFDLVKETTPFITKGISGADVEYWFSLTLNISQLGLPGDVIWLRSETTDNINPRVFIPSSETSFNFKKYFALILSE